MKVALVYDRVNKWGGAERLLLALREIWPEAPLYTAVYDANNAPWAKVFKVIPSFLQKFPLAKTNHEIYPWLTPLAFESFDFSDYDLVVSVTSAEAKGIITRPPTRHLCYCLTPTRYLWSGYEDYFKNKFFRALSWPLASYLHFWDKIAAQRPDAYIAISENVRQRIRKYYDRESEVIYPLVDLEKFKVQSACSEQVLCRGAKFKVKEKYFLIVSRLVAYKKVDIAVRAFNQLGWPLKIVGVGREIGRLKNIAGPNIEFLGQLTDSELLSYYQNCLAVIFPPEEDFGLVPLEVQSCGRPVIAFGAGGALETIIEGKTGLFFKRQTPAALAEVVKKFRVKDFCPADCRQNAERFSEEIFKEKWKVLLKKLVF